MKYMNYINGKYDVERKANDWFENTFLKSFEPGEYFALDRHLEIAAYKNVMTTVRENNYKLLSAKQWDIFRKYVMFTDAPFEEFANFRTNGMQFKIRICSTGFTRIEVCEIENDSKLKNLKSELDRAINVLGKDQGELQNLTDISAWLEDKYITDDEAEILRRYNKRISR